MRAARRGMFELDESVGRSTGSGPTDACRSAAAFLGTNDGEMEPVQGFLAHFRHASVVFKRTEVPPLDRGQYFLQVVSEGTLLAVQSFHQSPEASQVVVRTED